MRYVLAALGIAIVILIVSVMIIDSGAEPYTELYFPSYGELPDTIAGKAHEIPLTEDVEALLGRTVPSNATLNFGANGTWSVENLTWGRENLTWKVLKSPTDRGYVTINYTYKTNYTNSTNVTEEIFVGAAKQYAYTPYGFAFAIENQEGKDMEYTYRVIFSTEDYNDLVEEDVVLLADGQRFSHRVEDTRKTSFGKAQIIVELLGRAEKIHFWADEEPGVFGNSTPEVLANFIEE